MSPSERVEKWSMSGQALGISPRYMHYLYFVQAPGPGSVVSQTAASRRSESSYKEKTGNRAMHRFFSVQLLGLLGAFPFASSADSADLQEAAP